MYLKWMKEALRGWGMTRPSTKVVSKNCHYCIGRRADDNITEKQVALLGLIGFLWVCVLDINLMLAKDEQGRDSLQPR